ncbi:RNA-binding motif protein, X-linked 2-like [Sorex fumeus]|uniref:RNA-binding motif protein, X-linked 2-like n=1 Tax=Sorex fumeus TaxID=62283 RepID=UPI0024ADDA2C|nr:RNA-binding motif protein, X-linked 2-like [Sorex fumeus]
MEESNLGRLYTQGRRPTLYAITSAIKHGEIVNINLVRNKKTGKSKGFCLLCYEDHRRTILAVDNFNGFKFKGRTPPVDHVSNYRAPMDSDELDTVSRLLQKTGCGDYTPTKSSSKDSEDDKPTKKHIKAFDYPVVCDVPS